MTDLDVTTGALAIDPRQTTWTPTQRAALHQLGIDKAGEGDLAVFLNYAQRTRLDPFARQVYMIGRWDARSRSTKWTIQTSIDGMRVVAQRSGDYAGQVGPLWCGDDGVWHDVWLSSEPPVAAKVGVLRTTFREPLWAVARWDEFVVTNKDGDVAPTWRSMPSLMLAKCAEALALRKAFPHDLSGLYTPDEMGRAEQETRLGAAAPPSAPESATAPLPSIPPDGGGAAGGGGDVPGVSQGVPPSLVVDESTGEVLDVEIVEDEDEAPKRLRRALFARIGDLVERGLMPDTREHRLALCSYVVGRDIESSSDLSDAEVSATLDIVGDIMLGGARPAWHESPAGRVVFWVTPQER